MFEDRASETALLIAKSQVALACDPALAWAVGPERERVYRACLAAASPHWSLTRFTILYLRALEAVGVPGIYLHYALRKLRIAEIVGRLITDNGIEQVVVIAAGFDPLTAISHRQKERVRWIELDHPATQKYKRAALSMLSTGRNLTLLPIDLMRQRLSDLSGEELRPQLRTVVIAEGITMYLPEASLESFFRDVRACFPTAESYFIFTYMNRRMSGSIQFESSTALSKWWLAWKRERFVWGIEAAGLGPFLSRLGLSLLDHWDSSNQSADYLTRRGLDTGKLATGENIAVARIMV